MPAGVRTVTSTWPGLPCHCGVVTVTWVGATAAMVPFTPPNETAVAPPRLLPPTATWVPPALGPQLGNTDVTDGGKNSDYATPESTTPTYGGYSDGTQQGKDGQVTPDVIFRGETLLREEQSLWRKATKRILLPWLFRRTGAFLPIGTRSREFYRHYGVPDDRVFLVPYAVDNDFFMSRARGWQRRQAESKAGLGIEASLPVILYASKMTERKRAFDLLQAFERLSHPAA